MTDKAIAIREELERLSKETLNSYKKEVWIECDSLPDPKDKIFNVLNSELSKLTFTELFELEDYIAQEVRKRL